MTESSLTSIQSRFRAITDKESSAESTEIKRRNSLAMAAVAISGSKPIGASMFYKWKYDKVIATVLLNAGFPRNEFSRYWSVELTNAYCDQLKPLGSSPNMAAYISMAKHFAKSEGYTADVRNKVFDAIITVCMHDKDIDSAQVIRTILQHRPSGE